MKIKKIDLSPERKFITRLITNDDVINAIAPTLDIKLLDTNYSRIVINWLKEYQENYSCAPRGNIKDLYNSNKLTDDEDADEIKTFLSSLSKEFEKDDSYGAEENQEFAIDECHAYLRRQSENHFAEQIKAKQEAGESIQDIVDKYKPYTVGVDTCVEYNGNELLNMEHRKLQPIVPELLMLGSCVLLVGGPKLGKSWFTEQLAIAIASGGTLFRKWECKKRDVLLLANEDSERTITERFNKLKPNDISRLHVKFNWKTRGIEAVKAVKEYVNKNKKVKIVIIDCLATVKGDSNSHSVYLDDYKEMERWRDLTRQLNITIMIVHHTKKTIGIGSTEYDALELVNGSNGYAGAVDRTLVLCRARNKPEAKLYSMGRDCKDLYLALKWEDPEHSDGWHIVGDMDKVELTLERKKIYKIMVNDGGPMKPGAIATLAGCSQANVSQIIQHLLDEGLISRISYGTYKAVE